MCAIVFLFCHPFSSTIIIIIELLPLPNCVYSSDGSLLYMLTRIRLCAHVYLVHFGCRICIFGGKLGILSALQIDIPSILYTILGTGHTIFSRLPRSAIHSLQSLRPVLSHSMHAFASSYACCCCIQT